MQKAWVVSFMFLAASGALGQYRRGINISGAEFGQSSLPGVFGRDYTFNSENTFRYFGERKLGLMRIPLQWERLQPVLRGPLDPAYLGRLRTNIAWARAHGGEVIIDIHNFARYSMNEGGTLRAYIIDNVGSKVSGADLADLWVRLSTEFKFDGTVYAYDLMNEPHDMGTGNWKSISQMVLHAIRANQDDKLVLIPGDSWSSGNRWVSVHGPAGWIEDPANHFAYEAHQYFDSDESGTYKSTYDAELARNSDLIHVGRTRISHFLDWCRNNQVRGFVDEYGIPANEPRWAAVLEDFLQALDEAGIDGAYWAAGDWWPASDQLNVQPTANFTQDRPQMKTIQAHLGGGFLTALSAASVSVARATAGSLVTVYGNGFTEQTVKATEVAYPVGLADITVNVTDASGATAAAGLLYVSPGQVNLQMPALTAVGRANITVLRGGVQVAGGSIQLAATGPAIFTANSIGDGAASAQLIRVKADGTQVYENLAQYDAGSGGFSPVPIDFGPATDQVFLALYGTGIRGARTTVTIAAVDFQTYYAGPQGQYPGLDLVTLELSRSLAGSGQVSVTVKCDGVAANGVVISFL